MQKRNPNKVQRKYWKKWSIAFKIAPIVLLIAAIKFVAHQFSFEVMDLNALFTSLVAGTIFLIGFLSSGVLSDYKESEKIPTEITASLKTLLDDTLTVYKTKNSQTALDFIEFQKNFVDCMLDWFYKTESTSSILVKISSMNTFFAKLDTEGIQANYIIKMKNEQNAIRKMIMRIDTIRETDFVSTAYAIVEIMGGLISIGLIIIKIEPFYVSLFFTVIVTFLIYYMVFLIKDLDNPFDYSTNGEQGTEISLKPIHQHIESLKNEITI
jgi:hypothetical protein